MATKVGVAYLAASFVSSKQQKGVAEDYLAWIDSQDSPVAACDALLAAAKSSGNPSKVLTVADDFYEQFVGVSEEALVTEVSTAIDDSSEGDEGEGSEGSGEDSGVPQGNPDGDEGQSPAENTEQGADGISESKTLSGPEAAKTDSPSSAVLDGNAAGSVSADADEADHAKELISGAENPAPPHPDADDPNASTGEGSDDDGKAPQKKRRGGKSS